MSSFSPKPITNNLILPKDRDFVRLTISQQDATREELHAYFKDVKFSVDQQFMWSYFRWYTDLTWRMIAKVSPEDMVDVIMPRQIPMAIYLGYDIIESLLFYINDNAFLPKEKETLYHRIRQAFMESVIVVGKYQKKDVYLKDIVHEIAQHTKKQGDSIERAQLNRKVVEIFFSTIPKEFRQYCVVITPEEFRQQLFALVAFFVGVHPSKIEGVVELFVHPEKFDVDWEGAQPSTIPEGVSDKEYIDAAKNSVDKFFGIGAYKDQEPGINQFLEDQKNKKNVRENESTKQHKKPRKKSTALSYPKIKTMIDGRFQRDGAGEYVNIEGVITMLDSLAKDQNDPTIAELYYFDEQKGKFMWNNDILGIA